MSEEPARHRACRRCAVDDDDAIHEHVPHPLGESLGGCIGRGVADLRRIEHHEIRPRATANHAAVLQAKHLRRKARHRADRIGQADDRARAERVGGEG